jgi:hypothetical protein
MCTEVQLLIPSGRALKQAKQRGTLKLVQAGTSKHPLKF